MAELKILVVDDEESIREAIGEFLEDEGYEASLAENGSRALDMFEKNEYDIVFMDIRMPGIDGIETLREMKHSRPRTKVVIITGLPDEEALERAMAVSEGTVEGFLPKPFKPKDLRKILEGLKSGKRLPSFGLTQIQRDALSEIGRSGAEGVSRALSQIAGVSIAVAHQKTAILSGEDVARPGGDAGDMTSSLSMKCSGDVSGRLLIIVPWDNALKLCDLVGKKSEGSTEAFDESAKVLFQTAGGVIAASYLSALQKVLGLSSTASIEHLVFDTEENVLKRAVEGLDDTEHILAIESRFTVINVNVLFLPDVESLKVIFKKAGAFVT